MTWIRSKSKCRTYLVLVSLGSCFQSFAYRFLSRMLFASSIHWCSQRICVYFCLCLLATHAQRLFVIADHFQCIQYRPHTLFQMIGTFLSNLFIMCDFTLFLFHQKIDMYVVCHSEVAKIDSMTSYWRQFSSDTYIQSYLVVFYILARYFFFWEWKI